MTVTSKHLRAIDFLIMIAKCKQCKKRYNSSERRARILFCKKHGKGVK